MPKENILLRRGGLVEHFDIPTTTTMGFTSPTLLIWLGLWIATASARPVAKASPATFNLKDTAGWSSTDVVNLPGVIGDISSAADDSDRGINWGAPPPDGSQASDSQSMSATAPLLKPEDLEAPKKKPEPAASPHISSSFTSGNVPRFNQPFARRSSPSVKRPGSPLKSPAKKKASSAPPSAKAVAHSAPLPAKKKIETKGKTGVKTAARLLPFMHWEPARPSDPTVSTPKMLPEEKSGRDPFAPFATVPDRSPPAAPDFIKPGADDLLGEATPDLPRSGTEGPQPRATPEISDPNEEDLPLSTDTENDPPSTIDEPPPSAGQIDISRHRCNADFEEGMMQVGSVSCPGAEGRMAGSLPTMMAAFDKFLLEHQTRSPQCDPDSFGECVGLCPVVVSTFS